jgi:hypothetical protein
MGFVQSCGSLSAMRSISNHIIIIINEFAQYISPSLKGLRHACLVVLEELCE